ncbi:MAG: hypothetical protein KC621_29260 [Myxococcales bacterium]|nr:hypothetical protein [Myxococcales bacterium]
MILAMGAAHAASRPCMDWSCAAIEVQADPPAVRFLLQTDPPSTHCSIGRRTSRDAWGRPQFTQLVSLEAPTTWEDTDVSLGDRPEYEIRCEFGPGRLDTTYRRALVDLWWEQPADRGVVALVVDEDSQAALAASLDRLEQDLLDDGWGVLREVVGPDDPVASVRERLQARWEETEHRLSAALLLGAVPQPFAGHIAPDGHGEHAGAWPADTFYADLDGAWTDRQSRGAGSRGRANLPGDGRLDQSVLPGALELAVGRVDPRDLPAYAPLSPTDLLAAYLEKNHRYRTGEVRLAPRLWATNTFRGFVGDQEVMAQVQQHALRLFGQPATVGPDLVGALLDPEGWQVAMGAGPGGITNAKDVVRTKDFVVVSANAAYLGLFGSWFGDAATTDNLLRAALFGPGTVVATSWFSRPSLRNDRLAAGGTFGDMAVDSAQGGASTHFQLHGDPTLRLDPMRPPTNASLDCTPQGPRLVFEPSPDATLGHRVYRRAEGVPTWVAEERIGITPLDGPLVDASAEPGHRYVWRVVPVREKHVPNGVFVEVGTGVRVAGSCP